MATSFPRIWVRSRCLTGQVKCRSWPFIPNRHRRRTDRSQRWLTWYTFISGRSSPSRNRRNSLVLGRWTCTRRNEYKEEADLSYEGCTIQSYKWILIQNGIRWHPQKVCTRTWMRQHYAWSTLWTWRRTFPSTHNCKENPIVRVMVADTTQRLQKFCQSMWQMSTTRSTPA